MDNKKYELFEQYIYIMLKASRLGTEVFGISIQEKATTILQMHALMYIKENPNSSVGKLVKVLHMSSPAIAQFTNRLVRGGFIVKKEDPKDRRTIRLHLTSAGEKQSQELPTIIKQKAEKILAYISEEDMKTMIHILSKVIHTIEEDKK